ncbi:fasciclin domain-containing protein [Flavobacterium gelidilacus]|uniref:fasciclin domain-containing protein n=1 Tax=Flavobacterium gelidilacus TaxID=206041 RepID=UPI00040E5E1F|nr:fasciclin domain-containing protein [Flavobacterium gelidilacus]
MKNIAKLIKLTLIITISVMMFSCSNDDDNPAVVTPVDNSIAGIASRTPEFSSLVAALVKADLVQTLSQDGSLTVFAPDNGAFATFLSDNGYANLDAVPTPALKELLLNHVVAGTNLSTGLSTGYVKTLGKGAASTTNTLSMYINTSNGVSLNGVSNVTQADIIATNGVIHKVSAVIGLPTVVTHAAANSNFTTLVSLLDAQGLVPTLSGTTSSPFTVFAPLNSAFTQPVLDLYGTLTSAQKTALLTYHVVGGANVLSTGIPTTPITTLQGDTFSIAGTVITDAINAQTNIVLTDVQCSNGIIHAIDGVIRPF